MNETFTFFSKKKLYTYKNNNLYQNNRKLGGVVDIGKECESEMKDCIHNPHNKEVVGVGGFGKVSKFVCNSVTYVMKRSNVESEDIVHNEITILMKLSHRNIIEYICSYGNLSDNYIILPCAQKDLRLFLLEEKETLLVIEEYAIMDNLLKGMKYIHDQGIIHNDIKDENILIMPDFGIKYCDFGLSFVVNVNEKQKQINDVLYSGTKEYIVPESFKYDDLTNTSRNDFEKNYKLYSKDYWCLGNVFYHILTKNDKLAYSIKNLLMRNFNNPFIPPWLKKSLLNVNEFQRNIPNLNDIDIQKIDNNTQSGGFNKKLMFYKNSHSHSKSKMVQKEKIDLSKLKLMKSALKDMKRNNTLYGNQPKLERPHGVENRFTIEN
tara:strand:- start:2947 stop:4080 length:1134 start_codon:yes stop_codon:yes gene_type:complete